MKWYNSLIELYEKYDIFLCDVWGVLHEGSNAYYESLNALKNAKKSGKYIFLVTNSPRPYSAVALQLKKFGIKNHYYDNIITSGDITRDILKKFSKRIFHIGSKKDLCLYDNLSIEISDKSQAELIVCTGLFNENIEHPKDYYNILYEFVGKKLPFICSNPDILVRNKNNIFWCAGALAKIYSDLGGKVLFTGKPHIKIYNKIFNKIKNVSNKSRIIAIGDNIFTDIKGANSSQIDSLFICSGIHSNEYIKNNIIDKKKLDIFFKKNKIKSTACMQTLK